MRAKNTFTEFTSDILAVPSILGPPLTPAIRNTPDINLFNKLGKNIKLELGNYLKNKFRNGINILGKRSFSTSIIKLIEKDAKIKLRAKNFPKQLVDKQKKQKGGPTLKMSSKPTTKPNKKATNQPMSCQARYFNEFAKL